MATSTRPYRNWEEEMLAEYLATHHPQDRVIHRVRLGPHESLIPQATLDEAERRLLGAAWRRWADAIVDAGSVVYVVEAAMVADPGDISRLQTYQLLVPATPELAWTTGRQLRGLLVWAVDDPFARQVATRAGIDVRIFRPSNFLQWLSVKRAREQGPPRAAQVLLT